MPEPSSLQSVPSHIGDAAPDEQPDIVGDIVDAQGNSNQEHVPRDDNQDDEETDDGDDPEDDEDESDEDPIETLVAGRLRRQTAGNRMSTLLDQEADDDLTLLFAEEGEDNEFEDPDAAEASDVNDDSSSDDEDQGPNAGEDDLDGERQLQKEERAEKRVQKRKADKAFTLPAKVRKRVKIDESSTAPGTPSSAEVAAKHRKKSERVSWIPTEQDAPVRTSSRTLSVQNKERTMASMKESEGRRAQQIKSMEEAQKRKAAEKAKPMTQEERLAEAARTEKQNSKSLNRWEEMEKERASRQQARLDALQHRKLEGPVIRWHSGPVDWVDGKMILIGKKSLIEEVPDAQAQDETREREEGIPTTVKPPQTDGNMLTVAPSSEPRLGTSEALGKSLDGSKYGEEPPVVNITEPFRESGRDDDELMKDLATDDSDLAGQRPLMNESLAEDVSIEHPPVGDVPMGDSQLEQGSPKEPSVSQDPNSEEFLDGIGYYASLPEALQDQGHLKEPHPADVGSTILSPSTAETGQEHPVNIQEPTQDSNPNTNMGFVQLQASFVPVDPGPPPLPDERATRNLVSILNLANPSSRDKDIPRRILFNWRTSDCFAHTAISAKSARIYQSHQNHQALCAITSLPAKYRDPVTGLPYATAEAYATIKRVVEGRCRWSSLLGGWVGFDIGGTGGHGIVARGVPEGFVKAMKEPVAPEGAAPDASTDEAAKAADDTNQAVNTAQVKGQAAKKGQIATKQESDSLDGPRRTRGRAASRTTAAAAS